MKTGADPGWLFRHARTLVSCLLTAACLVIPAAVTATQPVVFEISYPRQRLPAPDFSLPDLENRSFSLADFRGKLVLIHFWATFCAPCLEEMPDLQALWQRYREQGLVVLGVAADRGNMRGVRDFARKSGVSFPVLLDPEGQVRNRYEVQALPMTYLVGHDGKLSGRVMGIRDWNGPAGRKAVEAELAKQPAE
jgi:peroxiredoxin